MAEDKACEAAIAARNSVYDEGYRSAALNSHNGHVALPPGVQAEAVKVRNEAYLDVATEGKYHHGDKVPPSVVDGLKACSAAHPYTEADIKKVTDPIMQGQKGYSASR